MNSSKSVMNKIKWIIGCATMLCGFTQIASAQMPTFIDASINSSPSKIELNIHKNDRAGGIQIKPLNCRLSVVTEKETFWPLEELQSQIKNAKETVVQLSGDGMGINIGYTCGSVSMVSETEHLYMVTINLKDKKISKPQQQKKLTLRTTVRPRLRPTHFRMTEEEIQLAEANHRDLRVENITEIQSIRGISDTTESVVVAALEKAEITEDTTTQTTATSEPIETVKTAATEETKPPSVTFTEGSVLNTEIDHVTIIKPSEELEESIFSTENEFSRIYKPISLGLYLTEPFLDQREELYAIYEEDVRKGFNPNQTLIKLAELYLAYELAHEARSFMESIDTEQISEFERFQSNYLRDISEILIGDFSFREGDPNQVIGNPRYETWKDYHLWTAIAHINNGDAKKVRSIIPDAVDVLVEYPFSHIRMLSPSLLEGAVDAGKWNAARDLSVVLDQLEGETEKPYFNYVLGKAALNSNRFLDAFDAFAKATLGEGPYAQKARLAVVELGLQTKTMPLDDARIFLEETKTIWRGDETEFKILTLLSKVYEKLGDPQNALIAMGDAIRRFPEGEYRERIRENAHELLDRVYNKGLMHDISLDSFFDTHKIVKQSYNYFEDYDKYIEKYADKLTEIGATTAASREYSDLIDTLTIESENDVDVDLPRLQNIKIKHAIALMKGANYKKAGEILSTFDRETGRIHLNDYNAALAMLADYNGDLLGTLSNATNSQNYEALMLEGDSYWTERDYEQVQAVYQEARERFPAQFSYNEAIRLLLAAHENNDDVTIMEVVSEFPQVMDIPEWQEIASAFAKPEPLKTKLSKNNTSKVVEDGTNKIELIENAIKK